MCVTASWCGNYWLDRYGLIDIFLASDWVYKQEMIDADIV
jgi:hypothetical protein